MANEPTETVISVETMVRSRTKEARVVLAIAADGQEPASFQLTPAKAQEIGLMLIQAAENATVESLVTRMLLEIRIPMYVIGSALSRLRTMRAEDERDDG